MQDIESPLLQILNPRSICLIGASNRMDRMGTWALLNVIGSGYDGGIYVVHPKDKTVLGIKAYPNIDSLPEVPELMVLVVGASIVPQLLEQAGRKGSRRAVIITAGFGEIGVEGKELQKKIDEVAPRYGIRYIGPNCIGFINSKRRINTSPFAYNGRRGTIGFASHSGSYICHTLEYSEQMDIGVGEWISMGNEGDLDIVDALEYFGAQSDMNVVGLYLEGIRRPQAFKEAATRICREKPVVALYAGGTTEGARSASSHTASISSSEGIIRGFLRQCGILQAETTTELYDWLKAFEQQPLPKGPRVAILTNSGGPATSLAEHVGRSELELPLFSSGLLRKIRDVLPITGSGQNPIDITLAPNPRIFCEKLPQILAKSEEIDAILIYGIFGDKLTKKLKRRVEGKVPNQKGKITFEMSNRDVETMSGIFNICEKPVLGASFDVYEDRAVRGMMAKGKIPVFPEPERAVKALEALWRYKRLQQKICS
ncbi:MAG: CoA-binding protein [Pseudomonadota bacterium]